MTRVLTGLAAWLAGTALAVGLAWFGANMVVRDAGVSPGVQVINADPPVPSAVPSVAPPTPPAPRAPGTPAPSDPAPSNAASSAASSDPATSPSPSPSAKATASATPAAKPSATASATASGSVRSYTLAGGRVALLVSGDSATLMTAVPDSGFSVETWSGTDWLRVDFSSGAQVSSLIASWYEHTPTITVTN
jgi:hypothetical protein